MAYTMENSLQPKRFTLPEAVTGDFQQDDLGDDFAGLRLSFPKVKIPAGGVVQFEESGDDPDNPTYVKYIEGILIYNHAACVYWAPGSEYDEAAAPLCISEDGVTGCGTPGGACELCEMNRYGTGQKGGKGKACKNMRILYILRDGEAMPIQLSLSPTSIRPFTDYVGAVFATRKRPTWSAVTQIGLRRVENGSNQYSVATFRKVSDIPPEQISQVREYARQVREQIKQLQESRAREAAERLDVESHEKDRYTSTEDGAHFAVTGPEVLNGTDELPM